MIVATDLHKRFGEVVAVDGVSFRAEDGRITGLLGPNGAGKTTTIRMVSTLVKPDGGTAAIDGADVVSAPNEVRAKIGVLPDARGLYPRLTARENLRYFGELQDLHGDKLDTEVAGLIERLDMKSIADRRVHGFSQGERAKVAIARALIHGPKNVLLDEPTNGLDVMSTRAMRDVIRNLRGEGRAVVFSSHVMQEVSALCDEIYVIARGKVVAHGSPDEILAQTGKESLEDAFVEVIGSGEGADGMSLRWRHVKTVMVKEALDGLRDRRSLMSALLFPLFGPVLIAVMFTMIVKEQGSEKPLELPVVGGEHAPGLIEHLEDLGVIIEEAPPDPKQAVSDGDLDVVLVIPEDFEEDFREARPAIVELIVDSSRRESKTPIRRTRKALEAWSASLGTMRLLARGVDPKIAKPLGIHDIDTATPQRHAANILNMVPMFVMLAIFVGGMFVATDSTAGERERKSLEPLLLNPVSRDALTLGKWLATTIFSSIGLLITLVGSVVALSRVPLQEIGLTLSFDAAQGVAVIAALLPLSFAAAGIQMLVASFARSFREAQTYLSVLTLVPTLPAVFLTLNPMKSEAWMAGVPVLGQQALLMDVLRGEPTEAWMFALAGGVALGLGAACVWATARLFERERIIFGG